MADLKTGTQFQASLITTTSMEILIHVSGKLSTYGHMNAYDECWRTETTITCNMK